MGGGGGGLLAGALEGVEGVVIDAGLFVTEGHGGVLAERGMAGRFGVATGSERGGDCLLTAFIKGGEGCDL